MTEYQRYALAFCVGLFFVLTGGTCFLIGRETAPSPDPPVQQRDTTWIYDTTVIERPVPVAVKPAGVEMLPVGTLAQLQARIDSLLSVRPDTAFVEVPVSLETKTYRGEDYEAQISGFRPSLDWVKTFPQTAYIKETVQDTRRWTFGISAGPGILWDGRSIHGGIGAVAGVQWRF